MKKNIYIRNPNFIRPWQHILDAINGYLMLANKMSKTSKFNGHSFNFGPEKHSIKTVNQLSKNLNIIGLVLLKLKQKKIINFQKKKF